MLKISIITTTILSLTLLVACQNTNQEDTTDKQVSDTLSDQVVVGNVGGESINQKINKDKLSFSQSLKMKNKIDKSIVVYKSSSCSCCNGWIEHLKNHGFEIDIKNDDYDFINNKSNIGISPDLASCHTAIIDNYFIEGHVPAVDIEKLLMKRPNILGLSVPGMPIGSPGMEVPGQIPDKYDVLAVEHDGSRYIFSSH